MTFDTNFRFPFRFSFSLLLGRKSNYCFDPIVGSGFGPAYRNSISNNQSRHQHLYVAVLLTKHSVFQYIPVPFFIIINQTMTIFFKLILSPALCSAAYFRRNNLKNIRLRFRFISIS